MQWPRICSVCRNHNLVSRYFSYSQISFNSRTLPTIYSEFERAELPLLGILKDIILDDECKTCFVKQTSVTSSTGQQTQNVGSVGYNGGIPTIATVTHTVSRPVDTTGSVSCSPGISMNLNLSGSRPPASYCGFTLPASANNPMSCSRPPLASGISSTFKLKSSLRKF